MVIFHSYVTVYQRVTKYVGVLGVLNIDIYRINMYKCRINIAIQWQNYDKPSNFWGDPIFSETRVGAIGRKATQRNTY